MKLLSEMIWGVIEHSKVQENNLPLNSWASCWLPYSLERIDKSPAVYKFFGQNSEWYTPSVKTVFFNMSNTKKMAKTLEKYNEGYGWSLWGRGVYSRLRL